MYIASPNNELKTIIDLQAQMKARLQLKGNWSNPILACFIYVVIVAILSLVQLVPVLGTGISVILSFILTGPLSLGLAIYFLRFSRANQPSISEIFSGFKNFGKAVGTYLLMLLFVVLWTLLLIVPGIIMSIAYSQVFYILADNPNMKVMDILRTSKVMMKGYKLKYFLLGLSFICWVLLCILTLGIGMLWLTPYIQTAYTNFYEDVKNAYLSNQQSEAQPEA